VQVERAIRVSAFNLIGTKLTNFNTSQNNIDMKSEQYVNLKVNVKIFY
jgi:hypothetical protein